MSRRLLQSFVVCLILTAVCWSRQASAFAADKIYTTQEFLAEKEQWPEWIDMSFKVEGRVGSFVGRNQFRLIHSDLPFHVSDEQRRTVDAARSNVEVTGRLKKESGKLIFVVDRVKILGSDVEQFSTKEAKLKSPKAEDWYELAKWAEARGKFYGDEELTAKARRVWMKGLQLERASLPPNDMEARLAMVEKLHLHQPDAALEAELVHEAARLKWQAAQKAGAIKPFAEWLTKHYPASVKALAEFPAELNRQYEANPLEAFRTADAADREILSRLLFLQVEQVRILALAKADGSNASQIADELAARIPERSDLADKYREQAFGWRLKSIASAPRQEALRLADDLKSRDRADEAQELLGRWVRAQELRTLKDDPVSMVQLADEFLQLAQDEPAAVKLLAEAHALDPTFEDAGDRLNQLGYRYEQNRWIKGGSPDSPAGTEKVPGQLSLGMTAEAVLLLLGEPNGKTRIITRKGTQEIWSFGRRGTPRLLIHLHQPAGGNPPKVTRYLTETSR